MRFNLLKYWVFQYILGFHHIWFWGPEREREKSNENLGQVLLTAESEGPAGSGRG